MGQKDSKQKSLVWCMKGIEKGRIPRICLWLPYAQNQQKVVSTHLPVLKHGICVSIRPPCFTATNAQVLLLGAVNASQPKAAVFYSLVSKRSFFHEGTPNSIIVISQPVLNLPTHIFSHLLFFQSGTTVTPLCPQAPACACSPVSLAVTSKPCLGQQFFSNISCERQGLPPASGGLGWKGALEVVLSNPLLPAAPARLGFSALSG